MAEKFQARTGLSFQDEGGKQMRLERGDEVPAYLVKRAPWLLEGGKDGDQAPVESLGDEKALSNFVIGDKE